MYLLSSSRTEKKKRKKNEAEEAAAAAEREEKVFPLLCLFSLFVPAAYNHLSALRLDEGEEEKKEKNECNSIVKLSAV